MMGSELQRNPNQDLQGVGIHATTQDGVTLLQSHTRCCSAACCIPQGALPLVRVGFHQLASWQVTNHALVAITEGA